MFTYPTLDDITARARQRVDHETSTFFTDSTEVYDMVNHSADVHLAQLVALADGLYIKETTITTVADTAEYALATDLIQIKEVRLTVDGYQYPLTPFQQDRVLDTTSRSWGSQYMPKYDIRQLDDSGTFKYWMRFDPIPAGVYTVTYRYVWGWTYLSSGGNKITLPFPEWLVLDVAIKMADKLEKESLSAHLLQQRAILEQKIERYYARKDLNHPKTVVDAKSMQWDESWARGDY